MQPPCEQRLSRTFTMPSSACCLQHTAALLPSILKVGCFVQETCEQRFLPRTRTMSSSACCWQYAGVLLPSILKVGRDEQESCEQLLVSTFTSTSLARFFRRTAVMPSRLTFGRCGEQRLTLDTDRCFLRTWGGRGKERGHSKNTVK